MSYLRKSSVVIILSSSIALAQTATPPAQPLPSNPPTAATSPDTKAPAPALEDSKHLEPLHIQKAVYPLQAAAKKIQGEVMVRLQINEEGVVDGVEVLRGDPVLVDSAVNAAKKCTFKPYIKNGKAVRVSTKIPFDFQFTGPGTEAHVVGLSTVPPSANAPTTKSVTDTNANIGSTAPRTVKVSSGVVSGLLIHAVQPIYPLDAKAWRIQGTVVLQAVIGKDGRVKDLKAISGPKELIAAAIGAVQQWRYRPYLFQGEPVEVNTQITVNFQLNH